jgi:acetylornithine deacetylase/succinyl-diaminopimelate desuccinylase family protein
MDAALSIHAEELRKTLADLVSINSVNPRFADGPGEAEVADYIVRFFKHNGISCECQEVLPERMNVICRVEGKADKPALLLEAHMDTATDVGMSIPPFLPKIDGKRLYGRGSCDTKAGLAAMLHAMKAIAAADRPEGGAVLFLGSVDEEDLFRGINRSIETVPRIGGAIVAEPTDLQIVTMSKGVMRWRFRTLGKVAHSSKPHLGVNAITAMARVVLALDDHYSVAPPSRIHPLLGSPTLNVGVIQAGNQVNQVPETCTAEIDRRLVPGETADGVLREFAKIVEWSRKGHPEVEVELDDVYLQTDPLETSLESHIVRTLCRIQNQWNGRPVLNGVPYASDASALSQAGIPSVILGPGNIDQAHSDCEYVDLDQVTCAARMYAQAALEF